jgi:enoyl-CoA hydratase/carnithine racemase
MRRLSPPSPMTPVGVIELAQPRIYNCLSVRCFDLILAALRRFEADRGVHAVLIRV